MILGEKSEERIASRVWTTNRDPYWVLVKANVRASVRMLPQAGKTAAAAPVNRPTSKTWN
jgi:hypothetical protein